MPDRYQPRCYNPEDCMQLEAEGEYVDWQDWLNEHNARVIAESKLSAALVERDQARYGEQDLQNQLDSAHSRLDKLHDELGLRGQLIETLEQQNGANIERCGELQSRLSAALNWARAGLTSNADDGADEALREIDALLGGVVERGGFARFSDATKAEPTTPGTATAATRCCDD